MVCAPTTQHVVDAGKLTVLLFADDAALQLDVERLVLEQAPEATVRVNGGSSQPDLVLIDVISRHREAVNRIRMVSHASPLAWIVAIGTTDDPREVRRLLAAGANEFVTRQALTRRLPLITRWFAARAVG